jgi:hypothetical protein
MAPRTQQNLAADERTEREFALDVNTAVANTEAEISAFAFGEEELENDADTSLEQMGDGLEGGDLDEEIDDSEPQDPDAGEEIEAAEGDETDEVDEQPEVSDRQPQRQDERRPQRVERQDDERRADNGGRVPAGVHRDRVRTERQRAETAEQTNQRLERELAETRGRLDMLAQTVNSQPRRGEQQQQERSDVEPDMFADPDGWKAWNRRQVQAEATQIARREFGTFRQEMQQRDESRINSAFEEAASGARGFEFNAAYRTLTTTLDPRNARDRATVARIVQSQDPTQALFDWFEDNGAEDFRASVAEQLGLEPANGYEDDRGQDRQQRRNGGDNRGRQNGGQQRQQPRQQQGQPRQVYRMPPSLNAARGGSGNRQGQQANPDMQDDSDRSAFDFAMRS